MWTSRQRTILFATALILATGCSGRQILATANDAGAERCGNAIDDDGDGQIDEGCDAAGLPDAALLTRTWAEYVSTLQIPPCPMPASDELVVTSLGAELDGGQTLDNPAQAGAELSLREALWIAFNRPGQDTILFDAARFPPNTPATIHSDAEFSAAIFYPGPVDEVCIDARDRGVIIDWRPLSEQCGDCLWQLGEGSTQIGLTLLAMPSTQRLFGTDITVAGCRFNTDGVEAMPSGESPLIELQPGAQATIGPGNAFGSGAPVDGVPAAAIGMHGGGSLRVVGNYFGFDPATSREMPLPHAFDIPSGPGEGVDELFAEDSVFSTDSGVFRLEAPGNDNDLFVTLQNNLFGVDRSGRPLPGGDYGVGPLHAGTFTVGPGNVIRNAFAAAVEIFRPVRVRITRNEIAGNVDSIVYHVTPPVAAPELTSLEDGALSGVCGENGLVELFASPRPDEGETFLLDFDCKANTPWSLPLPLTTPRGAPLSGLQLTATLTADDQTSSFSNSLPVLDSPPPCPGPGPGPPLTLTRPFANDPEPIGCATPTYPPNDLARPLGRLADSPVVWREV